MMKLICDEICKDTKSKINIIKLDINNITVTEYSKLFMTKDFWNKFTGEKLLIYQEDTMLFHNKIESFLQYDWIGAPFPIKNAKRFWRRCW